MESMLDAWNDPHMRHAMLVHLPIVLGGLGVLPLVALALTGFRNTALKLVCVAWFLLASAGAGLAAGSGEEAYESVEANVAMSAAAEADLEEHEELGEGGWIWPLIPGALVAGTLIPAGDKRRAVPIAAGALAIAASLGVAAWVGLTSHAGGTLVYVHGIGAPSPLLDAGAGPSATTSPSDGRRERDEHEEDEHEEQGDR